MPKDVPVGDAAAFGAGKLSVVTIDGREFGVTRLPGGEYRVFRNACPHKGAPLCAGFVGGTWPPSEPGVLSFAKEGEILVCPWHGFEYDLVDGTQYCTDHPSGGRLRLFPARVEDGVLVVTV